MVDLSNIQGGSLVPDLSGTINQVVGAFGQFQGRKRALEQAEIKATATEDAFGLLEGGTPAQQEQALSRLAIIQGPAVANSIRETINSGNVQRRLDLQTANDQGLKDTLFIKSIKDPAKRVRAIRSLVGRPGQTAEDVSELVNLANMNFDDQNTELRKDEISFTDTKTLLDQQFKKDQAAIVADARLADPQTDLGKAKRDLDQGLITKQDFKKIQDAPPEFQSTVGKLVGDLKAAEQSFGKGSPQAKAVQAALDSEAKGEPPKLTDIAGFRKEFTKQSGDFIKLRTAIKKIDATPATGPGDIAMVFNYMKILDPASTVREGEFATAANAGGIIESVRNTINKVIGDAKFGTILSPKNREQFKAAARSLFDTQLETQLQSEREFSRIATESGLDASLVIPDFVGEFRPDATGKKKLTGAVELKVGETKTQGRFKIRRIE